MRAHVDRAPAAARLRARRDESARDGAWDAAGREVAERLRRRRRARVAFATIGDPNIYSTFSYLAATVRALRRRTSRSRTVPGITAMQSLAASSGTVLVEGRESLALMPLTAGVDKLRAALETPRRRRRLQGRPGAARGARRGAEAPGGSTARSWAARSGMPDEDIRPPPTSIPTHRAPYLSTLSRRARARRHGAARCDRRAARSLRRRRARAPPTC